MTHGCRGRRALVAGAFGTLLAGAALLPVPARAGSEAAPPRPVAPGEAFPGGTYENLNAVEGGPASVDLGQVLGRKPVVLLYWIAGNPWSEEAFQHVQALADQIGADKLAFYGVAVQRPGLEAEAIRARAKALGIRVPVLDDKGFAIGGRLRVDSVPNISIIDRGGRLRLTNGASLLQVLGYKVNLEEAIRRTAQTGELMTYGALQRYYPVRELEGHACPDFSAPLLTTSEERAWSSLVDPTKLNVLIFWSIDCPHCRKSLPEINEWLRDNPEGVNVISAANVSSETSRTKTLEFCKLNDLRFPTLADQDARIGRLFRVTSTPTILIIRPDGVVDSVLLSGHSGFAEAIEERKSRLLKSAG